MFRPGEGREVTKEHFSLRSKALGGVPVVQREDFPRVKEVERMSLRRVPSWSATTISSETCWPDREEHLEHEVRLLESDCARDAGFGEGFGQVRRPDLAVPRGARRPRKVAGRRRSGKRAGMHRALTSAPLVRG